jgi:hypothetical protein
VRLVALALEEAGQARRRPGRGDKVEVTEHPLKGGWEWSWSTELDCHPSEEAEAEAGFTGEHKQAFPFAHDIGLDPRHEPGRY